jgi:hypothetical protein
MKIRKFKRSKISKKKMINCSSNKLELKMFIEKIRSIGVEVCECNKCMSYLERLYSLVRKIVDNVDLVLFIKDANTWDDEVQIDILEKLEVQVAGCIYNPDYLYIRLLRDNILKNDNNEVNQFMVHFMEYVKYIIVDYFLLLTKEEIDEFGDALIFIGSFYTPSKCKNNTTFISHDAKENLSSAIMH